MTKLTKFLTLGCVLTCLISCGRDGSAGVSRWRRAIVHHTATAYNMTLEQCNEMHRARGWDSCGYNALIYQDGRVVEARGWNKTGAHTKGYNKDSLGVAFVLDGRYQEPSREAIASFKKLTRNLKVQPHWDFKNTLCPGQKVWEKIR